MNLNMDLTSSSLNSQLDSSPKKYSGRLPSRTIQTMIKNNHMILGVIFYQNVHEESICCFLNSHDHSELDKRKNKEHIICQEFKHFFENSCVETNGRIAIATPQMDNWKRLLEENKQLYGP